MRNTNRLPMPLLIACAALAALLGGCATPTPPAPDVGAVVLAPQTQPQPAPQIVQQTEPMPAGYFQQSFLHYFASD